jgi:hypothetical protein
VEAMELIAPLFDIAILGTFQLAAKDEKLMDLVNTSVDLVVQDEEDQELLHFCYSNVQLLGNKRNCQSSVGSYELDEDLGPNLSENIIDELLNERVTHNLLLVLFRIFSTLLISLRW